jgi:hypothetical protein
MGPQKVKKLILHIGSEKTGTTSIQSMLSVNRELLEAKSIRLPTFLGKPSTPLGATTLKTILI